MRLMILTCALVALTMAPWVAALDTQAISEMNLDAVLLVLGSKEGSGAVVQGSGCCVDAQRGLVLTTAHQVQGVARFRGLFHNGDEVALTVVALDEDLDLALLQAARPLPKSVSLGDAQSLGNGAALVTISSPLGIAFSTNKGTVTNTRYQRSGHPVILTDLPLAQGSSGGPVFDENGLLIGLISGSMVELSNTVVAPINSAHPMLCAHGFTVGLCANGREEPVLTAAAKASETERLAVEAYNLGVKAADPAAKVNRYQEAAALFSDFYEAWFNMAVAFSDMNKLDKAIEAYGQAKAQRPNALRVRRNLGRVLLQADRIADGVAEFEAAAKLAPDDERAPNDLGEAYRRLKQFDGAVAAFERALALRAEYPAARFNLGLT